jgi:hypothetical protein
VTKRLHTQNGHSARRSMLLRARPAIMAIFKLSGRLPSASRASRKVTVERNGSETKYINGNDIICDNIECFASRAEILRPKKRIKVEDLSTVTISYIKDKHPDRLDENLRVRVLFDSGCSATMINKRFVKHWKKNNHSQNQKVVYQSW